MLADERNEFIRSSSPFNTLAHPSGNLYRENVLTLSDCEVNLQFCGMQIINSLLFGYLKVQRCT